MNATTAYRWTACALCLAIWLALNAFFDGEPTETQTDRLIAKASADLAAIEPVRKVRK
jgi:hypothetical protein